MMDGAIVQALEVRKDGAVTTWSDDKSGFAGKVTILRTYLRGTSPCGKVQHLFTKGGGNTFVLPYCLQSDGSWKIQF